MGHGVRVPPTPRAWILLRKGHCWPLSDYMVLRFPERSSEHSARHFTASRPIPIDHKTSIIPEIYCSTGPPRGMNCSAKGCERPTACGVSFFNCNVSDLSGDYCYPHACARLGTFSRLIGSWCKRYPYNPFDEPGWAARGQAKGVNPFRGSFPEVILAIRFLHDPDRVETCTASGCAGPGIARTLLSCPEGKLGLFCADHVAATLSEYRQAVRKTILGTTALAERLESLLEV
jgi:hypothetical protein